MASRSSWTDLRKSLASLRLWWKTETNLVYEEEPKSHLATTGSAFRMASSAAAKEVQERVVVGSEGELARVRVLEGEGERLGRLSIEFPFANTRL